MKKVAGLLLTAAVSMSLVGCGSDNETNGGKASNNTAASADASTNANAGTAVNANDTANAEPVELSFWRHDFAPEADSLKKRIASFEEKYPNIKVKMELIPNDQYETKIRTSLAGGNPPDIMALDGPTLASYAHQGALLPLDDYMNKDGNKDDIAKPVLESLTYNGKIYAAPNNDASLAMFYNKKMFKAKGIALPSKNPDEAWTWEQVLDAAKKLNDPAKGVYGWNPTPWGFAGHEGAPFSEMTFLWQAGGDVLSPDAKTAKGFLDSDANKNALKFWRSLYNSEKVAPKELPQDAFANGKVAIHVDGPWAFGSLAANFPNFKLGEDYDVAPLWKEAKQVTPNGSWNMAITAKSKHPEEAWLFLNWVTGVEGAKEWYKDTKNLPARLSTAEAFAELKEYPMNIFVQQSANFAHPRPVTPAYPAVSEAVRLLFEDVGLGDANIDDALAKAVDKIDNAIAQVK
ncbi:carbohydrate ABC transporter substrate-binding protein (CUT1 family) [Paenibacillus taihuensis]|uniref:Carbohydrate ABC transporter substrate-binding protein (CUT1 family) n=1 Tax=Paenibacillus taihuensis TaxID=1156355 RepID=A0A3D9SBH6_9BACL|nr:sugar ABC transporter substrate-binding protein [Paenibacillus taihuensis]REE90636.1 carbohydrate ABC transporter substrate-binding protein (CUT1 family) [Paenibacillus taihuensis]